MKPTQASPGARPRRWLLWGYLLLLLSSHLLRLIHPTEHPPDNDERTLLVRAVGGDRERDRAVRIAYRSYAPRVPRDSATSADGAARPVPVPPTVLLVHGSPGDNGEVTGLAEVLGAHYHTLAPDLPGFGGSTWDVPDYSNRAHAHYLLQLLDSLGVREVHLAGFSMGGGVVLQMEALAPERVRSITMLAGIGAQEYELLGDYHLNHAIHGLQLGGLWLLRELVPHFGWLDDAVLSVPYARNFYDTDQRPLRPLLARYAGPMLILHGERDPLVSPALAREHARIVPQAEFQMDGGDHFAAFMAPERIGRSIGDFVGRVERGVATTRANAAPDRLARAAAPFDPASIPKAEGLALVLLIVLLAGSTLVSEDLTCITAGLMVSRGIIGFWVATAACFWGIFLGDLLVFYAGRSLGRAVLQRAPLRWFITPEAVLWSSQWVARQGAKLVFATRVLPGTRLPSYFAAGMLKTSAARFALYFFLACLVWTPALVGLSAAFGEVVQAVFNVVEERAGLYLLVTALALFLLLKLIIPLCTYRGRRLLLSRWRRLTRWEFWPRWAFYPPVVVYVLWLAVRHRSLRLFTAVNPAIPGGGFVGESKSAILEGLAPFPEFVSSWELIPAKLEPAARTARVTAFRARHALDWPVVLKPDVGERGSGVAVVHSAAEVDGYLTRATGDTIVQAYAPGVEFGVFYLRHPAEPVGRIFSVTDKRFPTVVGDGLRDLETLILADDRAVCMAAFYLRRHAARLGEVLPAGVPLPLVELGTHCRGAAFYDGGWIRTPALEAVIERLSQGFPGFYFGRYDIRTPSLEDFQQGRNFKIVELNGATAEATHIYDPANGLLVAYRVLFEQWRLLLEIADANRTRGTPLASWRELWRLVRRHEAEIRSHER